MREADCPTTRSESSSTAATTVCVCHSSVASPTPVMPSLVLTTTNTQLREPPSTAIESTEVIWFIGWVFDLRSRPPAPTLLRRSGARLDPDGLELGVLVEGLHAVVSSADAR